MHKHFFNLKMFINQATFFKFKYELHVTFNKIKLKTKCQKLILAVLKKLIFLNIRFNTSIRFIIFFKLYN